jgi:hypothetical protein
MRHGSGLFSSSGGPGGGHIVARESTGKLAEIIFDRFGDFRGFVIETESGHERRFRATEAAVEQIVRGAWVERLATL